MSSIYLMSLINLYNLFIYYEMIIAPVFIDEKASKQVLKNLALRFDIQDYWSSPTNVLELILLSELWITLKLLLLIR